MTTLPSIALTAAPAVAIPNRELLYAAWEPDTFQTVATYFGNVGSPRSNNNADGTVLRWKSSVGGSGRDLVAADVNAPPLALRAGRNPGVRGDDGYYGSVDNQSLGYALHHTVEFPGLAQSNFPVLIAKYTDRIEGVDTLRYPRLNVSTPFTIPADEAYAIAVCYRMLEPYPNHTGVMQSDNFALGFNQGPGYFDSGYRFGYQEQAWDRTYGGQVGKDFLRLIVNVPGVAHYVWTDGVFSAGYGNKALANLRFQTYNDEDDDHDAVMCRILLHGAYVWRGAGCTNFVTGIAAQDDTNAWGLAVTDAFANYLYAADQHPVLYLHGDSNLFGYTQDTAGNATNYPRAADTTAGLLERYCTSRIPGLRTSVFGSSGAKVDIYSDSRGYQLPTRLRGKGVFYLEFGINDILHGGGLAAYDTDPVYSLKHLAKRMRKRGFYVIVECQVALFHASQSLIDAWNALLLADEVGTGGDDCFDAVIRYDLDPLLHDGAPLSDGTVTQVSDGGHYSRGGHLRRAEVAAPYILRGFTSQGVKLISASGGGGGGGGGGKFDTIGIGV